MGTETKHTATPWHLDIEYDDPDENSGTSICIREIRRLIHDFEWADANEWKTDLANAAFIVRAVNSHADLIAALEETTAALHMARIIMVEKETRDLAGKIVEEARAVLLKAKEVTHDAS